MAKIGIIAVFYNLEKYAKICIESIKNQTFKDYKCVLVDDNSTDKTFEILEDFSKHDERFVSIQNEKNYGSASHSRNVGLENINDCEYFMFIDGDDLIHPQTLEIMYENICKTKADFISYELSRFEGEDEVKFEKIDSTKLDIETYKEPLRLFLTESKNYARANACNKLYVYEKYKNFKFYEDIFYEDDYMYALQILSISSLHVRIKNPPFYFYRRHFSSITGTLKSQRYLEDAINRMKHTNDYFLKQKNIPKGLEEIFKKHMAQDAYRMIVSKTLRKTKDKKLLNTLLPFAQKEFENLLKIKAVELSYLNFFQKIAVLQFLKNNIGLAKFIVKFFA